MKEKMVEVLQAWFNEERGNRVTTNNYPMLINKLMRVVVDEENQKKEPVVPKKAAKK
jgi:hypothetical protein